MSSVTGMGKFKGNFSSITEVNKARPFKFHPGNRTGGITRSQKPISRYPGYPLSSMKTSKFLQRKV